MELKLADLFTAGEQGRQAGRQNLARKGLAAYFQGDTNAIQQVYANDPTGAFAAELMMDQRKESAEDRLGKLSGAFAKTRDPMIYNQWRQVAIQTLGAPAQAMPEALNTPEDVERAASAAASIAQAYGGTKEPEQFTLSPGSKRFSADGTVVAEVPFAPANAQYVDVPTGDGGSVKMLFDPRTGGFQQPSYGSGAPARGTPDFGISETNNYVASILGRANVDPNASPEEQAAALLPHLIQQESGGNPNAVSPKGARGLTQVMPATGRDPGFGVQPLRDDSPQENVRFGRDYLTAMLRRYPGRPDLALAAYNAGPAVADRSGGVALGRTPPKRDQAPIPSGYRMTADGNLEAIPGGPADPNVEKPIPPAQRAKLEATRRKEEALLSSSESAIDQTVKLIDDILAKRGKLGGVTGLGSLGAKIPGTPWADVAAKLDTLRGRSAFGALQRMRAESPTGGALGSVTERELALLQNSEAQLQDTQSPESLARSLQEYRQTLLDAKRRMRQGLAEAYEDAPQQSDDIDALIGKYL